jgi:hypothetical protein
MNYIDRLACDIYAINDSGEPNAEDMVLYRIYAVLALAKGVETTAKDVHDAWSAWQAGIFPEHRSLIPFDELPIHTQLLDDDYVDAIRMVANRVPV